MRVIQQYVSEGESFEKKPSAKGIIKRGDYLLIVRRREDDAGAGMWDVPGGGIEDGENKIDALKREVFEETGIEIDDEKYQESVKLKIPEKGVESDFNIFTAKAKDIDIELKPAT